MVKNFVFKVKWNLEQLYFKNSKQKLTTGLGVWSQSVRKVALWFMLLFKHIVICWRLVKGVPGGVKVILIELDKVNRAIDLLYTRPVIVICWRLVKGVPGREKVILIGLDRVNRAIDLLNTRPVIVICWRLVKGVPGGGKVILIGLDIYTQRWT